MIRLHPSISSPLPTQPIILIMPARTMARLEMIADTQNRMLEGITKERDKAITARDAARKERDSATHGLYIPTRIRGLYITADPPSPNKGGWGRWRGGWWRLILLERYQREDVVSMLSTHVPGIFVAHEEVERLMRIWYSTDDGMAVVKMHNLDMERDGIGEMYRRWNGV